MNFKLTEQDKSDIIQYVRGLLQGIALTESKAVEVLSNDYWLDWSESCDINLSYNDETNNWDQYHKIFGKPNLVYACLQRMLGHL